MANGKLKKVDPEIFDIILKETRRQNDKIELIASENFTSEAVLEAQGSVLTNKYAEGYPGRRWYGGCEFVDMAESLAIERAKKLFGAEHVNVQPHCGSSANMAVYYALLRRGGKMMTMDLSCGGHLTHGHSNNFSGKFFKVIPYGVSKKDERLDFNEIRHLAKRHKPKLILAGFTAYPRTIDFEKFREIADEVKAYLVVDMAHFAGLVAAGEHPNPVPIADVVTTTTHKTLRGPRAGMILCKKRLAKLIDTAVFPGLQGGPLMHVIAAKAVALKEASSPEFKTYQAQIVKNARVLAEALKGLGYRIVSGGTDTHIVLVDLSSKGVTGRDAASVMDRVGITANKNLIPFDKQPPSITSGVRLGTPAVTTRGMKELEMREIASLIDEAIVSGGQKAAMDKVASKVETFVDKFPIYADILKGMEAR